MTAGLRSCSLRVGLLHLAPETGALEQNRALIEKATAVAADMGAVWVVSGELVVSGYRFNTLFVIGRDGHVLGRHHKLQPTPGAEDWSSPGKPGKPVEVDGMNVGLLICADAYPPGPALRLRDDGAQLLVSSAAWWPGRWGPNGEWEARTLETGLPLIVCNRTGRDGQSDMIDAESVIVDRGVRLLTLRSPDSAVFVVDCLIRDGHVTTCEVVATARVTAQASPASIR